MFKEVEGSHENMQEYLDLMKNMSQNFVENSFEQNALINDLGDSSMNSNHHSRKDSFKSAAHLVSSPKNNAQKSENVQRNNSQRRQKDKELDAQSHNSKSSFYRLQNESLDDSEPSGANSSADKGNIDEERKEINDNASDASDGLFADSLKNFRPKKNRKNQSQSVVPDTINEIEESEEVIQKSNTPSNSIKRSTPDELQAQKMRWLHENQMIREDSKEKSSSAGSGKSRDSSAQISEIGKGSVHVREEIKEQFVE